MQLSTLKFTAIAALAGSLLIAGAGLTQAQQLSQSQMRAVGQACKADIQSLCSGVQPGGGRVGQCLQQNADKLSSGCKTKLSEALGK
ncbi:cysteine rich repeat-containing protein [Amorphus sp. 3PC139-8]|uniref:cysteine rich repeat-containing protein n=1 Tax=Amorphus sp. 3PC139-8 TaxID=2735676 RepID=UPI00345CECD1